VEVGPNEVVAEHRPGERHDVIDLRHPGIVAQRP
jgi:hypothetical protein